MGPKTTTEAPARPTSAIPTTDLAGARAKADAVKKEKEKEKKPGGKKRTAEERALALEGRAAAVRSKAAKASATKFERLIGAARKSLRKAVDHAPTPVAKELLAKLVLEFDSTFKV